MAAKIYFPLGENLTNDTGGLSSSIKVLRHCPEAVSQIRLKWHLVVLKIDRKYFFTFGEYLPKAIVTARDNKRTITVEMDSCNWI